MNYRQAYDDVCREERRLALINKELLEACQAIKDADTAYQEKDPNWMEKLDFADRLARQAIAKAEEKNHEQR